MKRLLPALAALALFAFLAYVPDPFLLIVFTFAGGIWIGLPCLLFGLIAFFVAKFRQRSPRVPLLFLGSVIAFFALCGLAVPANSFVHRQAELAAKAYPDRIRPLLESYRTAHGSYPTSLDQLPDKPPVPRLLRTSRGYHSDGRTYSFSFPQPGGLINVWDYFSESHTWHLST